MPLGPEEHPGVLIAGPVNVVPSDFGWVDFSVPSQPVINSGNFYLVMIQGGNAPNAAGLAIDQTNPAIQKLFTSRHSGPFPWIPAAGNFMMRAMVNGPGGPAFLVDASGSVTAYTVSRLMQGEEQNPMIWTLVGSGTSTQIYRQFLAIPSLRTLSLGSPGQYIPATGFLIFLFQM